MGRKPRIVEVRRISFSLPLRSLGYFPPQMTLSWHHLDGSTEESRSRGRGASWILLVLVTSLRLRSFHSRITLKIVIRFQPESPLVIRDTHREASESPDSAHKVVLQWFPLYPKQMRVTIDYSARVTEKRLQSSLS